MKTWVIVGASRGIGKGFVRQLLARGDRIFATVRNPSDETIQQLWPGSKKGQCQVFHCDMLDESSIKSFAQKLSAVPALEIVDHVVLNAGVLKYPNRATEVSYADLTHHLQTNTTGPLITAANILALSPKISVKTLTFISSDSGSTARFLAHEDGFAAYSLSKAALNQGLRHMAAELQRKGSHTIVLALHPGEVSTDMATAVAGELGWEVEGQMEVNESVEGCINVLEEGGKGSGTFWTWEGKEYPW